MTKRVYNFYAGPATLPLDVLKKAQKDLLDFNGSGMSVLEISHRAKQYDEIHKKASELIKELMGVPNDYKVLWLQGGASSQFFMVPLNLQIPGKAMEYVHTGAWAKKAIKEAKLYGEVKIVASSENEKFTTIPMMLNLMKTLLMLISLEMRQSGALNGSNGQRSPVTYHWLVICLLILWTR
jgi:phosphoserine aminotransferase